MSQVAGIVAADPAERARFVAAASALLPLQPKQMAGQWQRGDAHLAWAAAPKAPVAFAEDQSHNSSAVAFLMGRWGEQAGHGQTSEAARLLAACTADGGRAVARGGEYGLSVFVDGTSGDAWLGADVLGLFPVYYRADASRLVFATTPAAIDAHPDLGPAPFNVRGLVGNLLTMHMVGGQTLRQGVRRLTPGHALHWRRGAGATEVPVRPLVPGEAHFGESYAQHLDRFDAQFDADVRRDTANGTTGLLLSGGLDSRLLAAYLRRALGGAPVHGITCGKADDLEMRIAGRVAKRLAWPQHPVDNDGSRYAEFADIHLTHQQLGVGFNDLAFWHAADTAAECTTRVFTGVMGDTVMGGVHIPWGFDPRRQAFSYDTLFAKINRYGFTPEQVRRLVRPEALGASLDAALADLRGTYDACPGLPFQKVWLFDLLHRNRFHIAALAWEVGAGAWPVLAFTGAAMLDLAANTPADTLMARRVQIDLLCRHAPDLAALPLDRNSRTNLAPVKYRSGLQRIWDQKVMGKYRRALRKLHDRRGVETRYYYRVYDINNPAWRSIRRAAEPHRKAAETVLDPATLRELLPPPEETIRLGDGIVDAAKVKTLLGFMLWAGKNL